MEICADIQRGNYLIKEGNSFSNAKLEENGELHEKRPMSNGILEGIIGKHNGCEGDFTLRILSKALKKKCLQTAYRRKNFLSSSVITTKLSPNLNQFLKEVIHCRDARLENTRI